jgi:NitT/TauT family transport system substrate-binding protein
MQTEASWYVEALGKECSEGPLVPGVDFTVIPAGWTPDCLFSGQCDFYCGWKTNQVYMLDQQGLVAGNDNEFFLASDFLPFYFGDVIVTTKAYIEAQPEIVTAFVRGSMEGLQYTLDHPDEAVTVASAVPGVDPAHAAWRIPLQNTLVTNADTAAHGIGYMDPAKVQAMIDFLYQNGQLSKSFSADEVINNSFLPGP